MEATDLDRIRPFLASLGRTPTPADVAEAMRAEHLLVSDAALMAAVEALRRESLGAGALDPLLHTPGVTDVLVNGPDQVWVDRGAGLEPAGISFESEAEVRRLATRLAAAVGRRLDDGVPFVDGRLADGTRLHAVLAPIAAPGTCISLRVPSRHRLTLADWIANGALPERGATLLRMLIAARRAFLISGGTGTGKTTLLATLLGLVPPHERLLIVEDSRELQPDHPHCVRLEARHPNAEGTGGITLTDLVRQGLRMRPDRLVLGEVRGAELRDLLIAMNTGHEGGCGTLHANSADDVPARLEALGALGGLDRAAVHAQAAAALDVVIHLQRDVGPRGLGRRRVATIAIVTRRRELVEVVPAVEFDAAGGARPGPGVRDLERMLTR